MDRWESLFDRALKLAEQTGPQTHWTMGGGTVLMLRHRHRLSKDIDIFFNDPQPLGFVNPRLGGLAESMTSHYEESNGHVKLYFDEGEIDFIASPLLTSPGDSMDSVRGKEVRLETDVEIVAKKMWHRGHEAKARDLFDLALIIEKSPDALSQAAEHLLRHRQAFIEGILARRNVVEAQFNSINALEYRPRFEDAFDRATEFLRSLDASPTARTKPP